MVYLYFLCSCFSEFFLPKIYQVFQSNTNNFPTVAWFQILQSNSNNYIVYIHSCRGTRFPQRVSWIWHLTVWWWGSCDGGALGNAEYSFIAIAPRSTLPRSSSTWSGQIGLNCVLTPNWIVWNRTVLKFKQKTVLMINGIVWNRIIYMYKNGFGLK